MGQAKRRGTFQQRREQRLAKQYGLTNLELTIAYQMNRIYYRKFSKPPESFIILNTIMDMVNYNSFNYGGK